MKPVKLQNLTEMAALFPDVIDAIAPWHCRKPDVLVKAMNVAIATSPAARLKALAQIWLSRMPRRPLASQNIRASCRNRGSEPLLLHEAITCPWVAVNTPHALNAITIDIDHDDAFDARDELSAICLVPDIIMDPWSGPAHAVLFLTTPVLTVAGALWRPQQMADYAARLLAAACRGTRMNQYGLVKSPWGCTFNLTGRRLLRGLWPVFPDIWAAHGESDLMWITYPGTGPAGLRTIIDTLEPHYASDAVAAPKRRYRVRHSEPDSRGRNCELFRQLRLWAYETLASDPAAIRAQGLALNALLSEPLPDNEVTSIARSISRFMQERYRPHYGINSRRGRDAALNAGLNPRTKQQVAGARSAAARSAGTDAKVLASYRALITAGSRPTQVAVAKAAAVSLRTVKSRWKQLMKVQDAVLSDSGP